MSKSARFMLCNNKIYKLNVPNMQSIYKDYIEDTAKFLIVSLLFHIFFNNMLSAISTLDIQFNCKCKLP